MTANPVEVPAGPTGPTSEFERERRVFLLFVRHELDQSAADLIGRDLDVVAFPRLEQRLLPAYEFPHALLQQRGDFERAADLVNELGWEPSVTFEAGIRMTVDWYLNNPEWITQVIDGSYREYYSRMYEDR